MCSLAHGADLISSNLRVARVVSNQTCGRLGGGKDHHCRPRCAAQPNRCTSRSFLFQPLPSPRFARCRRLPTARRYRHWQTAHPAAAPPCHARWTATAEAGAAATTAWFCDATAAPSTHRGNDAAPPCHARWTATVAADAADAAAAAAAWCCDATAAPSTCRDDTNPGSAADPCWSSIQQPMSVSRCPPPPITHPDHAGLPP